MISIVVASYKSEYLIENILNSFIKLVVPSNFDRSCYELILVTDFPHEKELLIIEKYRKIIPNIKVVINNKRQGRVECNKLGLQFSEKKYCVFLSASDILKSNFLEEALKEITKNNSELIEFKTTFQGLVNWTPNLRCIPKEQIDISKNPEIITKILPIQFTKIWSTNFLKSSWVNPIKRSNSRFYINELFLAIPKVKKYTVINKVLTITVIPKKSQINTLRLTRVWIEILQYYKHTYKNYVDEIYYAFFYATSFFLMIFTIATKNDLLIKKQIRLIHSENEKLQPIRSANHYLQSINKEANWLKELPSENKYPKQLRKAR